jgi:hypothetical protein
MVLHVKLRVEDANRAVIEYSGNSDKCDGLLIYDKISKKISVEIPSDDDKNDELKWLFGQFHRLIAKNELTDKKRRICVG